MRLSRRRPRIRRQNAILESRYSHFVAGVQVFEHDAWIHGLECREYVKAGEVLGSGAVRSLQELEQVFAFVCGDDFVKALVRRVGLECRERVRKLADEIFCVVVRLRGFCSRFAGLGGLICAWLFSVFCSGDCRRKFKGGHLGCVHFEVHVGGIFVLFDGLESQNGVQ